MAQQQKPQILTMLLWMVMIFLGYQMFFNKPQQPSLPAGQLLTQLRADNFHVRDGTAAMTFSRYESALNEDKSLNAEDKERKLMEANMLLADAQFKGAKNSKEIQRVIFAFDRLQGLERKYTGKPIWTEKFRIPYNSNFKQGTRGTVAHTEANGDKFVEITPAELKAQTRELASDLGKNTPVWGFFPGYQLIDFIVGMTGKAQAFSYAFACFLLAFFVRAIVFPLSKKQMIHGRQMSQLAPLAQQIKDQYKPKDGKPLPMEKQNEMNQRVMALYGEYGLNPLAGCFPLLLQMPLFFLIYQSMIHYRFEFEKGTFLWINPSIGQATDGFLGANLGQKDYILIVLYGISMLVTTWLQPVSDPTNARQQRIMGMSMAGLFSVMMFFWPVPSAFILYWVFTNVLATAQSLWIYKLPMQPLEKKHTPTGGKLPTWLESFQQQKPPSSTPPSSNGKIITQEVKTGTPKTHKPKKKKK